MANNINVQNIEVARAKTKGTLPWSTWVTLTTRGEQVGLTDLLTRWRREQEEPWAVVLMRYDCEVERIEGWRWKLVDWQAKASFKASRMWKNITNDQVLVRMKLKGSNFKFVTSGAGRRSLTSWVDANELEEVEFVENNVALSDDKIKELGLEEKLFSVRLNIVPVTGNKCQVNKQPSIIKTKI